MPLLPRLEFFGILPEFLVPLLPRSEFLDTPPERIGVLLYLGGLPLLLPPSLFLQTVELGLKVCNLVEKEGILLDFEGDVFRERCLFLRACRGLAEVKEEKF
jgi:hypothetical protein